jgi:hypothetical protein
VAEVHAGSISHRKRIDSTCFGRPGIILTVDQTRQICPVLVKYRLSVLAQVPQVPQVAQKYFFDRYFGGYKILLSAVGSEWLIGLLFPGGVGDIVWSALLRCWQRRHVCITCTICQHI